MTLVRDPSGRDPSSPTPGILNRPKEIRAQVIEALGDSVVSGLCEEPRVVQQGIDELVAVSPDASHPELSALVIESIAGICKTTHLLRYGEGETAWHGPDPQKTPIAVSASVSDAPAM